MQGKNERAEIGVQRSKPDAGRLIQDKVKSGNRESFAIRLGKSFMTKIIGNVQKVGQKLN